MGAKRRAERSHGPNHEAEMKYKPEIVTAYFLACGLPAPEYEFKFHPVRKWRFDIVFSKEKIAIEIDGGIWLPERGAHCRGARMLSDWEKRNSATALGWRIFYCQPKDLCTQVFVDYLLAAMRLPICVQEKLISTAIPLYDAGN